MSSITELSISSLTDSGDEKVINETGDQKKRKSVNNLLSDMMTTPSKSTTIEKRDLIKQHIKRARTENMSLKKPKASPLGDDDLNRNIDVNSDEEERKHNLLVKSLSVITNSIKK